MRYRFVIAGGLGAVWEVLGSWISEGPLWAAIKVGFCALEGEDPQQRFVVSSKAFQRTDKQLAFTCTIPAIKLM